MSATSSPYGLQPISDRAGTTRTHPLYNGIASGLASAIYIGQAVMLDTTNGTITPCTATTDKIFGVFAGCEYTPTGGRPTGGYWPASATYTANLNIMIAYIWPAWNPNQLWQIQADGIVTQGDFGAQFNLSNFGNGNTLTGLSTQTANHTAIAASSQGQLQLVEFFPGVNSAVGDAFTDLIVAISYPQAVVGFQTSPG